MSRGIEFPPLRNGVDYLQDAVRRLGATPSPTDLKYAVLHLHGGVEVMLKYRLICEDWRLILEDADEDAPEVTEQDYEAGRFRSIGIGKALKRLQELDGITFTTGQKRAAAALDRFRNQLQHHGLVSTAEAVEAQAAKALGFILDFIDSHITPDSHLTYDDEWFLSRAMPDIRSALSSIAALVDQRMQSLRPVLERESTAWCPDCGLQAVTLTNGDTNPSGDPERDQPRCVFCTARWDSRSDYVDDFASNSLGFSLFDVLKGGDHPAGPCPECGQQLLLWYDFDTGELGPAPWGRCFFCECEFNDRCAVCDDPVHNSDIEDGAEICADCMENIRNED